MIWGAEPGNSDFSDSRVSGVYACSLPLEVDVGDIDFVMCRLYDTIRRRQFAYLCSDLVPKITCQVVSPGLSIASGFEHPASTLPTRFPAALGIGHGLPAA